MSKDNHPTKKQNIWFIGKVELFFRWIMGIIFLLLVILAFSSCCKKPSFKYTNGIYMPDIKEEKAYKGTE